MSADQLRRDLWDLHRLSAVVDGLYDETQGEETDDVRTWEEFVREDSTRALEALAEYDLECRAALEAGKQEALRLKARAEGIERRQQWAREKMVDVLQLLGTRKLEVGTVTVAICAGRERVIEEDAADPSLLPESLVRAVPERIEPDKPAIRAALKAGKKVFGYRLERGPETAKVS